MSQPPPIIRPETVAQKMAALKNLQAPNFAAALVKQPRLAELAWFIQSQSLQAGALQKFATDFLALFSDAIGTDAMRRIGKTDAHYDAKERNEVIDSFPGSYRAKSHYFSHLNDPSQVEVDHILFKFHDEMLGAFDYASLGRCNPNLAFVSRQNFSYFLDVCKKIAEASIPDLLLEFCSKPDEVIEDVWWFRDLPGALIEMMDAHAGRLGQEIVMTQVARECIDALDFAWQEKSMVEIIGDSRFGKTESVKTYCAMFPGRSRLVKTPCDNCDRSLVEAIAEAVGIELTLKLTARELNSKVEFVLKHSGLIFVFDEAAWLIPQRYSPQTAPMRLNYIRSKILECGSPVALVTTPQFFGPAAQKFERVTGFTMSQWRGRIMRTAQLPTQLSEEDLAAVARHHFPELCATGINRVVGCALVCESYLFAVLKIAKNARAVARKNNRENITLTDLDAGITLAGIVIPERANPEAAAINPVVMPKAPFAVKRGRGRPQKITRPVAPALEAPTRETTLEIQPA